MSIETAKRVKYALATAVVVGAVGTISVASAAKPTNSGIDPAFAGYTKDQCKNGGWETFGTFKNQGDCVSYFATGGKNQPKG
jgi:hypothetical protein